MYIKKYTTILISSIYKWRHLVKIKLTVMSVGLFNVSVQVSILLLGLKSKQNSYHCHIYHPNVTKVCFLEQLTQLR